VVLYLDIPEELEKKFRVKTLEKFGSKKGALNMAAEEAIKLWLKSQTN
jgi:hypothetical protein